MTKKIYVDVFVSLLLHISEDTYHRQFVKFARLSKIVKFSMQLEFWGIKTLVFINFKKKKSYIFKVFKHAFRK